MLRGELWWADLGLPRGSAPALQRPVLIISAGPTTDPIFGRSPSRCSRRNADSVVNVTQIATIDRAALGERIGPLPDWLTAQVDAGLTRALALALA
jgi:mRNA interferase MazF